jgi:signal transduction histidine kinase
VHLEDARCRAADHTTHGNAQTGLCQLREDNRDLTAVAASLRRIVTDSNRMSLLLRTLADASRLTLGRPEPKRVDADLGTLTLIGELLERLDPEAADRVQVEMAAGGDLTGCWDPDLLERVIANLVSNALKYSPLEQPVGASLTSSLDAVELSVTDHGIGISEDELPRLYGCAGGAMASRVEGSRPGAVPQQRHRRRARRTYLG